MCEILKTEENKLQISLAFVMNFTAWLFLCSFHSPCHLDDSPRQLCLPAVCPFLLLDSFSQQGYTLHHSSFCNLLRNTRFGCSLRHCVANYCSVWEHITLVYSSLYLVPCLIPGSSKQSSNKQTKSTTYFSHMQFCIGPFVNM